MRQQCLNKFIQDGYLTIDKWTQEGYIEFHSFMPTRTTEAQMFRMKIDQLGTPAQAWVLVALILILSIVLS